jgi:uncharacterized protein YjeT (DUF2065 family)
VELREALIAALGLMLVLEGILPFVAPGAWREAFRRMTELPDAQLRVIGLASMIVGLALLLWVH